MGEFAPEGGEGLRLQAKQMFGEACSRQRVGVRARTHTPTLGKALVCLVCLRSLRASVAGVVSKGGSEKRNQ